MGFWCISWYQKRLEVIDVGEWDDFPLFSIGLGVEVVFCLGPSGEAFGLRVWVWR